MIVGGVGVELETQANFAESDPCFFADGERAPKIEISPSTRTRPPPIGISSEAATERNVTPAHAASGRFGRVLLLQGSLRGAKFVSVVRSVPISVVEHERAPGGVFEDRRDAGDLGVRNPLRVLHVAGAHTHGAREESAALGDVLLVERGY